MEPILYWRAQMNLCPCFPHLYFDENRLRETRTFLKGYLKLYVHVYSKVYDILKVRNGLVKSVHHVMECTPWSLVCLKDWRTTVCLLHSAVRIHAAIPSHSSYVFMVRCLIKHEKNLPSGFRLLFWDCSWLGNILPRGRKWVCYSEIKFVGG